MNSTVIPKISNNIKARMINEEEKQKQEVEEASQETTNFYNTIKQNLEVQTGKVEFSAVQQEWVETNPENEQKEDTTATLSEDAEEYLAGTDELEMNLEEFIKTE